jgi:hypothetical protein
MHTSNKNIFLQDFKNIVHHIPITFIDYIILQEFMVCIDLFVGHQIQGNKG